MNGELAVRAYRAAMTAGAFLARSAVALPGIPPRWRAVGDRLGSLPAGARERLAERPVLWVHAASVGELAAVRPLVAQLAARFPGRALLCSTTTRTGLERARAIPEVDVAILLPIDAPVVVGRLLDTIRLEAFCFTETEVWPTLLGALAARNVPAIMVSGRVSARVARRARWVRPLYRRALAEVTCCMQSADDAARIVRLGADPRRVHVVGCLKFEAVAEPLPERVQALRAAWRGRPVVVAGSTHAGEEELLLDAAARLAGGHPGLVVLLAPRHLPRVDDVVTMATRRGFRVLRWSVLESDASGAQDASPLVVVLDEMGVLVHVYDLATVAFVGGSLVPVGGHNVLEPARHARPVVVGPYTEAATQAVERLLAAGGAIRISSASALSVVLDELLRDRGRAADMGRRAAAAMADGQGALERHLKILAARLGQAGFARSERAG